MELAEILRIQTLALVLNYLPLPVRERIAESLVLRLVSELRLASVEELEGWLNEVKSREEYVILRPKQLKGDVGG